MAASECPSCGVPTRGGACIECKPAGALLDPDPAVRWKALQDATSADRPRVVLAAIRGGRLWTQPGPDGQDAAEALLTWLVTHKPTLVFLRYLAEDAVYGHLAWALLGFQEPTRTLQRAPEWLAMGHGLGPLVQAWRGQVSLLAALGFRLGGAGCDSEAVDRVIAGYPFQDRWWARITVRAGRKRPSHGAWLPPEHVLAAAAGRRRWPIQRIEPGGIAVCGACGECLPAEGPCTWCGRDASVDVTLLSQLSILSVREPCPRCGLDLGDSAPVECGGCGQQVMVAAA